MFISLFLFQDCLELDPCCEPKGCKLKPGSQCSVLNHACCQECVVSLAHIKNVLTSIAQSNNDKKIKIKKTCPSSSLQFKPHGILCRASEGDCDVPEYCPGDNGDVSKISC